MSGAPSPQMLDECSREPIHIPGAIQPHGALLTLSEPDLVVRQASANAATWLGLSGIPVGQPLADVLPTLLAPLRILLASDPLDLPHLLAEAPGIGGGRPNVTVHRHGGSVLVEFEARDETEPAADNAIGTIGGLIASVAAAATLEAAADAVSAGIRRISGYDRVMIYRFDPDGNGEVIAEAIAPGVESFLGLRYPASDVPSQARAMMLVARVRMIVDSAHIPVPLVPRDDPLRQAPIDLTRCALRAVSPIHLQYLRNMRVGASLTCALIVDGRLWGLIACHHLAPRAARHATRSHVDLVGGLLAARIAQFAAQRELDARLRAAQLQQTLLEGFTADETGDWTIELMRDGRILRLIEAGGAALRVGGAWQVTGEVPAATALGDVCAWLDTFSRDLVTRECLSRDLPTFAAHTNQASGCLAIRLTPGISDWLIWFRPEQMRTVRWGGDPTKAASRSDGQSLTPRTSFAAWAEIVHGTSREWTVEDRIAAEAIRSHLQNVVARVYAVRRTLARSNRELTEFAYSAAHDLKEPLRTMAGACQYIGKTLQDPARNGGTPLPPRVAEFVRLALDAGERGKILIEDLLNYARLDHEDLPGTAVSLAEAFGAAAAQLGEVIAVSGAVITAGDLPIVHGNRRQLVQLLQNLLSNAIKYQGDQVPLIAVDAIRRSNAWEVTVSDNGIGINPAFHEGIFTIFKRLHNKQRYQGTGVGLALCRKIAGLHGGRIWVESNEGAGATFHVTIADQ